MIYTREDLFEMREEMAGYRDRIRSKLKSAPEGRIMITTRNGRPNYFRNLYDEKGERIRREGITRKRSMIADLAIKDYNVELLSLLDEDIRLLDRLLLKFRDPLPKTIIERMSPKRKRVFDHFYAYNPELLHRKGGRTLHDMPPQITDMSGNIINIRKLSDIQKLIMAESGTRAPVDMTRLEKEVRQEIMEAWAATPYIRNQKNPEGLKVVADKGLIVRSRLEALSIEKLNKYHVPFRYEQMIWFDDYPLAPDITILKADGRLLFWEICGMMDIRGYREAQIRKRAIYESNGFAEWKGNLIFTYARGNEYNSEQIESVVRSQILLKI